jgi:hypothetical protein
VTAAAVDRDPVALVERLDATQLREEIARLDEKQRALRVLLRAAMVRERRRQKELRGKEARRE